MVEGRRIYKGVGLGLEMSYESGAYKEGREREIKRNLLVRKELWKLIVETEYRMVERGSFY